MLSLVFKNAFLLNMIQAKRLPVQSQQLEQSLKCLQLTIKSIERHH